MNYRNLLCPVLLSLLLISTNLSGSAGEPIISNLETKGVLLAGAVSEDFHMKPLSDQKEISYEMEKEVPSSIPLLPFFSNDCSTPTPIPFGQGNYDISFSTIGSNGTDVSSCGTGDVNDIWFSFQSVGGFLTMNTDANTNFSPTLSVFTSCGGTQIGCNAASPPSTFAFLGISTQDCTPYLIRVSGVNGATGTGRLFITALAGQSEIPCNGFDDDCNPGTPDVPNNDGDGYTLCAGDCNDNNPNIYPGAPEILCNGVDENCNGMADDDKNTDGDPVSFCNGDCDDNNPNRYPGNTEILCNNFDENCNGNGDDNKNTDGDPVSFCAGDCNDNDPNIYPGAQEILCNGIDENCNGMADDDKNTDGDPVSFCNGDCDDNNPNVYPSATEILCNGIDENCNGMADDDPQPPTISCPGNQTGFVRNNCVFQLPNYTGLATAMDNCGNPIVSQDPSAGSLLGVGNHTITLTATDGNANSADCTFTLSVTDPNPMVISGIVTDQKGPAVDDGAIDISVSGGVPSYIFLWSNGAPTEDITDLASGTYVVTVTDNRTCTQTADFFVNQGTLVPVTFNFTVFPFGLFNPMTSSSSNRLTTLLNTMGLIPTSQPFSGATINYTGLEVFPGPIPPDVSDWILMRFRPVGSPSTPSEQMAVVVYKDGKLRDVDGNFPGLFLDYNEDYWIEVFHLNHLSVIVPSPFGPPPSAFILNWDFTTSAGAAYTNPFIFTNGPQVQMNSLSGPFWGMIGGNAMNGDFAVEANDVNVVFSNYNSSGTAGPWDVNRDGQVDANDLNFLFFNYLKAAHKPY